MEIEQGRCVCVRGRGGGGETHGSGPYTQGSRASVASWVSVERHGVSSGKRLESIRDLACV
jgi:hypothetical protein